MPTLQWVGKNAVVNHHYEVPFRLLNKKYSFTATSDEQENTDKNRIIHGDNLEVLKLLQKSYYGKVKMIYIDPPHIVKYKLCIFQCSLTVVDCNPH